MQFAPILQKRQIIRESLQFSSRLPVFPFNGQIQNDTFERIHFSPRGTPAVSGILKRRAPNGKALLHILHEAKIIYSCYLEKQSKPTVWKTAIIVWPQREKARLFFFVN